MDKNLTSRKRSMVKCSSVSPSSLASCRDCDWISEDDQHEGGARKAAYNHSFRTGHKTECQVVKNFHYEGAK